MGEVYGSALSVLVRDADGRPVKDAPVTFSVWSGGGALLDDQGAEAASFTTTTNALGMASVRLRSGTHTADDPVYLQRRPEDTWPTRALVNTVEVEAGSHLGPLVPAEPFELIAYPGPVETLRRTDTDQTVFQVRGLAGLWADTIQLAAEDHFGNPVSNVPVQFAVGDMASYDGCTNGETEPRRNAVVFDPTLSPTGTVLACPRTPPILGDCGGPTFSGTTSVHGTAAGVILGSSLVTTYTVSASIEGIDPLSFEYQAVFGQFEPSGDCETLGSFRVSATTATDAQGNDIQAERPGQLYTSPLRMTFLYPLHEVDAVQESTPSGPRYRLKERLDFHWVRVPGEIELQVSNGGTATEPSVDADLVYSTQLTTGPTPGDNQLQVIAHDFDFPVWRVNELDGTIYQETHKASEFIGTLFQDPILDEPVTAVWGVLPKVLGVDPDPPILGPTGQTTTEVRVGYEIDPPEYRGLQTEVDLYDDGEVAGTALGTTAQGLGLARIQRGFAFDVEHTYELQAVLNRGSAAEIRSDKFRVPLFQKILRNVSHSIQLDRDVDLLNQRSCDLGTDFTYTLTQAAAVTLELRKVESLETDGTPNLGSPVTLIDGEEQAEGDHSRLIAPGELAPGDYEFTLRAVATVDGRIDEEQGSARVELRTRDSLPVGHTLVHGVDLWDGHLSLSREDLSYPGRGPALSFQRTYSSNAGSEPGPLGPGWSHNYESRVVVTPCGDVIVIGGEGSGMRFVDDGQGGLKPLKGYHGTLIANQETLGFDFYAKGGTLYRYGLAHGREFYLQSITDPNGNSTVLDYETGLDGAPRLAAVVDPAGRTLTFHYETKQFALWGGEVLVKVDGPDGSGQSVSFTYDAFGNLARAEREDGIRAESYTYATDPGDYVLDRNVLLSATDEIDGGQVTYTYQRAAIRATADVVVPSVFYTGVTLQEGSHTSFEYDLDGLDSRAPPELVTRVTDGRGKVTTYALNQYGSPLRISDALGHETAMTWSAEDVVPTSKTDANGVTTTYEYDADANVTGESVTIDGPDNNPVTYTRSYSYDPAASFDPPYIKDRRASQTDRTGATTTFSYDAHGNLLEQAIEVTDADAATTTLTTGHTYTARGDLASTTDPRGKTTRFTYDAYGNLASATDSEGGKTVAAYDVRSLPIRQVDPRGGVTVLEYDTLGRPVRRVLPKAQGEAEAPEETWAYDDPADTVTRTDAAGRATITTKDLQGRVVQVVNPAGGSKLYEYDAEGNKTLESSWFDDQTARHDTTFTYDAAGRLAERSEPLGRTTDYVYDPAGNLVRETFSDASDGSFVPRVTEYEYDGLNRRITTRRLTATDPVVTRMGYDGEGRLVRVEDPLGRVTTTDYDELGRAIRVQAPEGQETVTLYDGAGNRTEERRLNEVDGQEADQVRRFVYDGVGRVVQKIDALGHGTLFEYDLSGNLTRRIDRRLDVVAYTYDARNRRIATTVYLTRVTSPQRQVTTRYAYDAVGHRVEEDWPNGDVVTHAYDALDRKIRSEDSLGLLEAATYDARGNVLTATDAEGRVTTTTYDALDRATRIAMPADRVIERTWDVAGDRLSEKDPRGHTTTFAYDRLNRLVRATDPAPIGTTRETAYDAAGNKIAETDRRGQTTSFEYDGLNRLVRRVSPAPLSYETTYTYDRVGNKLSMTDPRGIVTETRYDLENRPVEMHRAGQTIQEVEYDAEGNKRFVTDADGHVTGYEYDERNLVVAENRPLAAITATTYDDMGDPVTVRGPEGRVTSYVYDGRRRRTSETNFAGETTSYAYDGVGNRTELHRPEGNTWLYRYDDANRLAEVEAPDGGVTAYTYDGNGNRLSQTDTEGHTTSYEYDELDRLTATVYPAVGTAAAARETYAYDGNGNRTKLTDPKGQTIDSTYDALDRETLKTYSLPADPTGDDLASVATEYDPNGNPTQETETYTGATGTRVTAKTYDAFDRLETVTDPNGEQLTYAYDPAGNRTRLTDPDGKVTRYTFDELNRTTAVTSAAGVTEYAYYRDSRLRKVSYPNGSAETTTYDAAGRVATIANAQGATVVSSYAYEYDGNGNRTRQTETNGATAEETTYGYDSLDRLLEVDYPDRMVAYTYDRVGNRLTEQGTSTADGTALVDKLYAYDARNRLTSLTDRLDASGSVAYGYDANGNQTTRTTAAGHDCLPLRRSGPDGGGPQGRQPRRHLPLRLPGPAGGQALGHGRDRALRLRRPLGAPPDGPLGDHDHQVRLRLRPASVPGQRHLGPPVLPLRRPGLGGGPHRRHRRHPGPLPVRRLGQLPRHGRHEPQPLRLHRPRARPRDRPLLRQGPLLRPRARPLPHRGPRRRPPRHPAEPASVPLRLSEPDGVHRPDRPAQLQGVGRCAGGDGQGDGGGHGQGRSQGRKGGGRRGRDCGRCGSSRRGQSHRGHSRRGGGGRLRRGEGGVEPPRGGSERRASGRWRDGRRPRRLRRVRGSDRPRHRHRREAQPDTRSEARSTRHRRRNRGDRRLGEARLPRRWSRGTSGR